MPEGLLGKKVGMTRVFDDKGAMVPVTVIEAGPCAVLQVKTPEKEGYRGLQLGFEERLSGEQWERVRKKYAEGKLQGHLKGLKRPMLGHLKTTARGASPKRFIREVRYFEGENFEPGQSLTVAVCEGWKKVDVIGVSKGRGTAGTVKAHGFAMGPRAHGTKNIRQPGSVGQKTFPARTFPGKRMYKHLGAVRSTVRNLNVVKLDPERNLILVEGAVPGPNGGYLVVRKAVAWAEKKAPK